MGTIKVGDLVQIKENGIDIVTGSKAKAKTLYGQGGPYWATVTKIVTDYQTGSKFGLPEKVDKFVCSKDGVIVWQVQSKDLIVKDNGSTNNIEESKKEVTNMAVRIGSARIDERGKITGGQAGDQTGTEVSTQNWYNHSKRWIVIRAKDATQREKIAKAMEMACANNKIGYDQSNRYSLFNAVKTKGYDPSKCTEMVETDCSALVRVCCCYAGIIVGDFNTGMQPTVLGNSGKFDITKDPKYTQSSDYLLRGDILVTELNGHTVVVLDNGAKADPKKPKFTVETTSSGSSSKDTAAKPTIKKGSKGAEVKVLQQNLNKVMKSGLSVDGDCGSKTEAAIRSFQSKYKLSVDGVYGPKSYEKMKSVL